MRRKDAETMDILITEAVEATVHRKGEVTETPREGVEKTEVTGTLRAGRPTARAEEHSTEPEKTEATGAVTGEVMAARTEGLTAILTTGATASPITETAASPTTAAKEGEATETPREGVQRAEVTGTLRAGASDLQEEELRPMGADLSQAGVSARPANLTEPENRHPENSKAMAGEPDVRPSRIRTNSMRMTSRVST